MEFTSNLLSIIIGHVISIKESNNDLKKLSELPITSEVCIDKELELSIFLFHRQKLKKIMDVLEENQDRENYYHVESNTFPFENCKNLVVSQNGLHIVAMIMDETKFYSRKRVDGPLKELMILKDRTKKYYKVSIIDNEGRAAVIEYDCGVNYRNKNRYDINICKIVHGGKCIELSNISAKIYNPLDKTTDLEFLMKGILTEKCGLEKFTVCIPDMYKYNGENGKYEPYSISKDITEAYPKKLAELIADKKYSHIERYDWDEWGTNIRINNTVYYFVFIIIFLIPPKNVNQIMKAALMKDVTNNGPVKIFLINNLSDKFEFSPEGVPLSQWAHYTWVNLFEVNNNACYFSGVSHYLRFNTVHALDLEQIYKMKMYSLNDRRGWGDVKDGIIKTKIVGNYLNGEKRPVILDDGGLAEYYRYTGVSFWKGINNTDNTYSVKLEKSDGCFINIVKGDGFIEVVLFPEIKRYLIPTIALKYKSGVVIDKVY